MASDDGYEAIVEAAVRNAIAAGDGAIGDIAVRLGDVDPALILDIVKRLGRNDLIAKSSVAGTVGTSQRVHSITLPIPHPLDYDWRLSDDSIETMARTLSSAAGEGRLCLVGVPTVFRWFIEEGGLAGGADLYDFSADTIRAFKRLPTAGGSKYTAFLSDARYDLPRSSGYTAAFLDPPWYLDDIVSFLRFASAGCAIGSKIYVSMPGIRTRPGIRQERDFAASVMCYLGLESQAEFDDALSYETPPFERQALRRGGIDPPMIWRRGMMLCLEKVSEPVRRRVVRPKLEEWDDITYAGVRFRVRLRPDDPQGNPVLRPAVQGAILPSVSRRDPRRRAVDVWTSGNGVYLCAGSAKLRGVLRALASGEPALEAVEKLVGRRLSAEEAGQINALTTQIADIVAAERILS